MTMPLQFDKPAYLKVLREAGVPPDLAEAHAEAIESGLAQPIVLPADLALMKADMLARMDELKVEILARVDEMFQEFEIRIMAKVDAKLTARLRPVYLLTTVSLVMSTISVVLNCVILMRL